MLQYFTQSSEDSQTPVLKIDNSENTEPPKEKDQKEPSKKEEYWSSYEEFLVNLA